MDRDMQQTAFDGMAIVASVVCLVHCVILPALLLALPLIGAYVALPEAFHVWALLFIVPTSAIALAMGYRSHRSSVPAALATCGVVLLVSAEIWYEGTNAGTWIAVLGSVVLVMAHVINFRWSRGRCDKMRIR